MAIFQAHGTEDPLVPFRWGEITSKVLTSMCANYSFHSYPMAHTSCPEVPVYGFQTSSIKQGCLYILLIDGQENFLNGWAREFLKANCRQWGHYVSIINLFSFRVYHLNFIWICWN